MKLALVLVDVTDDLIMARLDAFDASTTEAWKAMIGAARQGRFEARLLALSKQVLGAYSTGPAVELANLIEDALS